MTWQYHIQRAITNEWLDRDAQLIDCDLEWGLSTPGTLNARLDAVSAKEIAQDGILMFDEWSTIIYAEENDVIRWAGIVDSSQDEGNGERSITAVSFSGYPHGRIYTGELRYYQADGFDLVRMLWNMLQSEQYSDLGVQLNDTLSGVLIGSEDPGIKPTQNPGESLEDYEARVAQWQSLINDPYELNWWNTPDYGQEIDNLMAQTAGEYVETHAWINNKTEVDHRIDLYWPIAGNRRTDLRFVEGENIKLAPLPQRVGGEYANYVIGLGAGEDRHTLRHEVGRPDNRLRRDMVAPVKDTYSPSFLATVTRATLDAAQLIAQYDTIEVFAHPNAEIGSWQLGDEIFVQTHSGFEQLSEWVRIVGWAYAPASADAATIKVMRIS